MVDRVGQYIDDYRLIRRLGAGAYGEVYLGEHAHDQSRVAVKVLQLVQENLKEFIKEASTAFRLKHAHIVQLYSFGISADDTPYLIMDYAPNGTLRERHPKGTSLSLDVVLSYLLPLATALQYAHDRRVVHRDVKPENVLIGLSGEVLLSDFGIAVVVPLERSLSTQNLGGTAPYMAPEQIRGKPQPASDQYALGIMAYEWLCGVRPFQGNQWEILEQQRSSPPPPLREKCPDLPLQIEAIILKALAKEPTARFSSVRDFATAFELAAHEKRDTSTHSPSSLSSQPAPVPSSTEDAALPSALPPQSFVPPSSVVHVLFPPPLQKPTSPIVGKGQVPTPPPSQHFASPSSGSVLIPMPHTSQSSVPTTHTGRQAPIPPLPQRKKAFAWRLLFTLALVPLVVLASGSLFYFRFAFPKPSPPSPTMETATAHTSQTASAIGQAATATASVNDYNQAMEAGGIMEGFNPQHTGFNPYERILTPSNISRLLSYWARAFSITSSPVVVDDVMYFTGADSRLYAFNISNCSHSICAPLWISSTSSTTKYYITSTPAIVHGVIYVGSFDHKLYAFKAGGCGSQTCSPLWSGTTDGEVYIGGPTVVNDIVYVISDKLYAFKAGGCGNSMCSPLWTASTGGNTISSPAVTGDSVYVGGGDGKLYAFKAGGCGNSMCSPLWTASLGNDNTSTTSPSVANGVVYIGSDKLYAFKAGGCGNSTCSALWTASTGSSSTQDPPAVASTANEVYIAADNGTFYTFKASGCGSATCKPVWTAVLGDQTFGRPVIANGVIYVGSLNNELAAFRVGGCGNTICSAVWKTLIPVGNGNNGVANAHGLATSPTVANGVVYIGISLSFFETPTTSTLFAFHLPSLTPVLTPTPTGTSGLGGS